MEEEAAPITQKRRIDAEHILQTRLKMWVREAVISPHKFFAFDRSAARGQWTHAREKARGIVRATPDTLLCVAGIRPLWAELKDPRLTIKTNVQFAAKWPDQWRMGQELLAIGHAWGWWQSISDYCSWLVATQPTVRLSTNFMFLAYEMDATVQSLIETAEMKKGVLPKRYKVRAPRPTIAQVRRAERARLLP